MSAAPFGPWSPAVEPVERIAQLRSLASLCALMCGAHHPLVGALRRAEIDGEEAARALTLLDGLPALTKRRLLSTFGAVTWPRSVRP